MSEQRPQNVPTVELVLDCPYTLAFTLGAMRRIKGKLGTLQIGQTEDAMLDVMGTYVWACMSEDDRARLTVEQVEDRIHPGNMEVVATAVGRLIDQSQGGPEGNVLAAVPLVEVPPLPGIPEEMVGRSISMDSGPSESTT